MAASFVRYKTGRCPQVLRLLLSQSRKTESLPFGCQRIALSTTAHSHVRASLRLYSSPVEKTDGDEIKAPNTVAKSPPAISEEDDHQFREHYIPITRQSIIRHMIEEKNFLTEDEKKVFPNFSMALDSALVHKYHHVLQELKVLFEPINPDKDTVKSREWSRRDKLDNEFWLLQHLEDVMDKANFYELPKSKVEGFLKEHETGSGVKVSVNPDRYAVLRFWVLGREVPEVKLSLGERLANTLLRRSPRHGQEYYKRVVVAIRLKKDSKLILKCFKEVPTSSLEMLLPDGTIQMSTLDRNILYSMGGIAALGAFAKLITVLAGINVDWMLLSTLVTGAAAFRGWSMYKNKRNQYLEEVSRTLYFKNVANNRGLLTLLVDRAEDESFKEALLTYAFLLTSRRPDTRTWSPSEGIAQSQKGGLSEVKIKAYVENWIEKKTGVELDFDTGEAIRVLKELGLLYEQHHVYHVLMLDPAQRILPQSPQSVIARSTEADITEGYDRDEYLETEEEYKHEEKKYKMYGWK